MRSSRNIFLFIFLMFTVLFRIQPALADTCTLEEQESIKRELNDALKQSFSDFKAKANHYNSLASSYLSSCENLQGSEPEANEPSRDDMVAAKVAGVDEIMDTDLYKYSGLPWGRMKGSNDSCKQMHEKAAKAFQSYMESYNAMRERIQDTKMPVASQCICDGKGQNYMCASVVDPVGSNGGDTEQKGQNGHCESFTALQARLNACPLCGIFEAVLNASAKVAHVAWESAAKPLSGVVIIFCLVLLALESLKAVASVGGYKIGAYLKSVMIIITKIAITVFLLSSSQYIYSLFISPVIKGGLDMGLTIASVGGNLTVENMGTSGPIISQEFDADLFNQVINTVKSFGTAVATLPACGAGLICHSATSGVFNLPNFYMFISGLIMLAFGVMIWLSLSFYLIDCTVQLGMVSALVPLFIACWPFKITQTYTMKGVKMLMNTFFHYAMMGTVLLLGTEIVTFAVSGDGQFSLQELIEAINNSDIEKLKSLSSLDGIRVLMLLACSIFAMKLIGKVDSLAGLFSQGAGADTASKMGGTGMALARNLGFGALSAGAHAASSFGESMLGEMGVKVKIGKLKEKGLEARQDFLRQIGSPIFGKYQNQQTGSGLPSEGESSFESGGAESGGSNPQSPVNRNERGNVVLPNGDEVNGFGEATANEDGGVTFTSVGADGSRSIDSYDKDGNRHVQTFNGSGEMTSNYSQNKDGSSSGFITREDGSVQRWDDPAGSFRNVGAVQERAGDDGTSAGTRGANGTPRPASAAENEIRPASAAENETRPTGTDESGVRPQQTRASESEARPQAGGASEIEARPQATNDEQQLENNAGQQQPKAQPKNKNPKQTSTGGADEQQLRSGGTTKPKSAQTRAAGTPQAQNPANAPQQSANPTGVQSPNPTDTQTLNQTGVQSQNPTGAPTPTQAPQQTGTQPQQTQAPQQTATQPADSQPQQPQTPQPTTTQQQPLNPTNTQQPSDVDSGGNRQGKRPSGGKSDDGK